MDTRLSSSVLQQNMKILLFLLGVNCISKTVLNTVNSNTIMIEGLLQETLIQQKDQLDKVTENLKELTAEFDMYKEVIL